MIGSKFGNYEIRRHIGSGGMGEVYEATDSKLGRSVAVKVLPEAFTHDAERVARFEREARVLASLNHSAIAAVHGFEDAGGRSLLVMELVPGQTLAERIQSAPLSLDEALSTATQIADGLEYAHDKGIVHRDLKPANVKITPEGKVKLLDFGLAKAFESDTASVNLSNSPTLSVAATNVGVILGTAAYMAPEQARGRAVDKRADIWAFGVVLYEMLTGKQLFKGEDLTETLAAVVKEQPALDDIPARIRPLLRRCLEKDPSRRLRDISGFKLLLESSPVVVARKSRAQWMGWATAAGLGVALAVALWVSSKNKPDAAPIQFQVPIPNGIIRYAMVSPDGRHLLMQIQDSSAGAGRRPSLWVRRLDSLASRELSGTESDGGIPFWLPDNRSVVFSGSDSKLKKIDVTSGPPTTLCTLPGVPAVSGSMNSEGVIIFGTPDHGVMRVSRSGGMCSAVTPSDRGNYAPNIFPAFLPDGRRFIYVRGTGQMPPSLFLGSIDLKPEQQETTTPLISAVGNPGPAGSLAMMYVPAAVSSAARVLFLRENTIWTQMFDDSSVQILGEPAPIVEGASIFSASSAALTFLTGTQAATQLMWLTAKGATQSVTADSGFLRAIALSPDAERVAIVKGETIFRGSPDIWLLDLVAGRQEKFTADGVAPVPPLWSRDGKYIIYSMTTTFSSTTTKIYRRPVDRSTDAELLLESPGTGYITDWSRDGRFLLRTVRDSKRNNVDLSIIALDSKTESALIASSFAEVNGRFSPDGKWIAYFSDESGRNEVYVRSFTLGTADESPHVGPPVLVSKGGPPGPLAGFTGATGPIWRGDSKSVAYPSPSGWVAVEMTSNVARPFGEPQPLPVNLDPQSVLDITPDFQRVLVAQRQGQSTANAATVILNWQQMLRK